MKLDLLLALVIVVAGAPVHAQQADVIRGRVITQEGSGIENARVTVTSIPNNVARNASTDKTGRYAITFAGGDGDYWVSITAIGFAPKRFELKRVADEAMLLGDAKLVPSGVKLDAVKVQADRLRPSRTEGNPDISGTEKTVGSSAVDPSQAGNLAAMAASVPGVQLIPGADGNPDQFSVFGLSGDQNSTTLNGLGFAGSDIPRDATTRTMLGTSPWDVSRGGFSGAQMGLSTQSGSNFSSRGLSTLLNAPAAQWTDRAGRSLGAQYTSASIGAATAGPVSNDKTFYSVGYQLDRRTSDLPTLADADQFALRIAGVAPDSVSRLRSILSRSGAPMSASGLPSLKVANRGLLLANFDWAPPTSTTGQAVTITAASSFVRLNAPFAQITALPTNDLRTSSWFGAVQGRQTMYFGSGILSETSAGINQQRASTTPYLAMPSAGVRVNSTLDDGSSAITGLTFGGSPTQRTSSVNTMAALQNQLSWFTLDNKHRIQLTSAIRYETFNQNLTTNALGNFYYNSLADLEAERPTMFTRTLTPRVRQGGQVITALALGDAFRASPDFQLQYGVRVDANRFLQAPALNSAVSNAFGAANDVRPNRVYLSPRVGFSWSYGEAARLPVGEGFVRGPRAVVRGGIGVFQNTPNAQIIGSALTNTGLSSAVTQLTCVGAAVPRADWDAYRDPTAIPSQCADGSTGGVFANSAPDVWMFDPRYAAPRSLRSNVNWSGAVVGNRLFASLDATYSRNLNQPGAVNLNFDPTIRFRLANEGNRPIFARAAAIVPATGSIAVGDARLIPTFGNVMQQRSELSSVNRQLSLTVQPVAFSSTFSWNLGYVLSTTRDAARGFTSTVGDPRAREWSRSPLDSRHQIVYGASYNFFNWVPVGLSGSLRSGRPFTPLVSGDINGDGFRNDRAFIIDPNRAGAQDPALGDGMRSLLDNGSRAARSCLREQLDQLAGRNSCQEPWSSTSNLTIGFNPVKFRLPQRLNVSLYVNNALGAVDLLLHGEAKRRGWGQAINPDATLLFVRGFDAETQRFRYEVNPRFGSTNPRETINRNPVVVTAQFRVDVGFTRERQLLTQSLDRGRRKPGTRSTDQDIRGMGSTLIPQNPMALIMREADSLKLTRKQADSVSTLNRAYAIKYDSIWTPVAKYLAALPVEYDRAAAYERYRRAREATIDVLMALAPAVRGLLTDDQLRILPQTAVTSLDRRYLAAVRSSTAGGANLGALGLLAQMGWAGGTVDPSAAAVMIHR